MIKISVFRKGGKDKHMTNTSLQHLYVFEYLEFKHFKEQQQFLPKIFEVQRL